MKEKILLALKAKFTGVNANILSRIAAMLAKTAQTDEDVATAVEGVTKEQIELIEAYGDSRATDAQKTAIANYEQRYGLKDGAKVAAGDDDEIGAKGKKNTGAGNGETPSWAQALIDSNKQLAERLNKIEGEKRTASRKDALNAIISKLPDSLRKGYSRISVDALSDDDFETLKAEVTNEVEAISKETNARRAVFGKPTVNGDKHGGKTTKEATDAEVNAVVDKLVL